MSGFQTIEAAEQVVLNFLEAQERPVGIRTLVDGVTREHVTFEPSQLKVATLNLISTGKARVNSVWEVAASEEAQGEGV